MHDAIVIGGGPAGLQAALTLGRMHRDTVLFDSGEYRNATVPASHNTLSLDGVAPAELRRRGRSELAAYPTVVVRDTAVDAVAPIPGGFAATLADGEEVQTRTVILATGVVDTLPDIPGLAEEWGDRVAHCPFCHGHEFAGLPVALLGVPPHSEVQGPMLRQIGAQVTVIDPTTVSAIERHGERLRVHAASGAHEVAGVFVATSTALRGAFAVQLHLALQESGAVAIDAFGRTSVDGVYAAGDMAHSDAYPRPLWSIAAAIAAGQLAATAVVQRFVAEGA